MAGWRGRLRIPRRCWAAGAVLGLVLLVGAAVLAWPAPRGGSSSSAARPASPTLDPDITRSEAPLTGAAERGAAGPGGAGAADAARAPAPPPLPVAAAGRQLVRTAQLDVEVADPAAATGRVRVAAAATGGLVVQEQSGRDRASLVLRVPTEALDRLIDQVAAVGTVTDRSAQVTDRTAEAVDLDARVTSQQASVARVRALLAQASSIGDVVAIESELARREADLDSLTNQLAALRDQVALSTLTVELRTPGGPPPQADQPPAGFLDGLAAGWRGLRAVGAAAGAVVGYLLPFLPVLAVLGGTGWAVRRLVRRRHGGRAERPEIMGEPT